jgi:hypothetical protein
MANVYIEARPKGHPEGTVVVDYVIEDRAEHLLGTCRTQEEALSGRGAKVTPRWSHWSAISTIRKSPIIGDRLRDATLTLLKHSIAFSLVLAHAGRNGGRVVSTFIASVFARDDAETAKAQWRRVACSEPSAVLHPSRGK